MTTARLNVSNPQLWRSTLDALITVDLRRSELEIRCSYRQCLLGGIAETRYGPLFWSRWKERVDPARHMGVKRGERELNYRERKEWIRDNEPHLLQSRPTGTIGLLFAPPGHVKQCPDLVVRCLRCARGRAALLDRDEAVARWQKVSIESVWTVQSFGPNFDYVEEAPAIGYHPANHPRHFQTAPAPQPPPGWTRERLYAELEKQSERIAARREQEQRNTPDNG